MVRTVLGAITALAVLAASRSAAADEPAFGDRGQIILTADRLFPVVSYTRQTITATEGPTTTKTTDSGASIAVFLGREPNLGAVHTIPRVAVDFTVLRHLTIGTAFAVAVGLDGAHTEERTPQDGPSTKRENSRPGSTILGVAPRVGYVIPLGTNFAFWPRAGFAFYSMSSRSEQTSIAGSATTTVTDTLFSLDLDPQLVWLPIPHFFVHVGPLLDVPLSGSHDTSFSQGTDAKERADDLSVLHCGLSAGFGGWIGL